MRPHPDLISLPVYVLYLIWGGGGCYKLPCRKHRINLEQPNAARTLEAPGIAAHDNNIILLYNFSFFSINGNTVSK